MAAVFGSHERLEKHLRQNGRGALAEVLRAESTHRSVTHGPDQVFANTQVVWNLKLRVKPDGEQPFDVDVRQSWPQLDAPRVGQVVPVLYDPGDHSKVALDHGEAGEQQAAAGQIEARLNPQQAAALEQFGGGSVHDLMSEAMADPQGFAARMQQRAAEAQRAAMSQAATLMAQAQAQAEQAGAGAGATPGPAAGSAEDRVDRLGRLADLRDRGALTDAEFEALKKQVLAE